MRILIVDTCYEAFLASHYNGSPGLAHGSYDEQWRSLMDTFFGTGDAYSHFLGEIGVPAHEAVVNCEPLQSAWAREHGLDSATPDETLLAQVEDFEADVVYIQNLSVLSDATMRTLHDRGLFLAGQIASEAPDLGRLRMYDLLLTSFPHFVEAFRAQGIAAEYFRIGFDPRVLERLGPVSIGHEVVFVGALNGTRHRRGNAMLARAARRAPIEFWGYDLRGWPPWSPLRRRYRGEAWGLDMYRLLASSRIVLNRHIAAAKRYANNMRLYEATGVGALLVTDKKINVSEFFQPGTEVITYDDDADLVRQVEHYLADEEARLEIASAGHARTMREHTYATRMRELQSILEHNLR